jgi:selT/selW/selH-like putative selenoprotein
LAAEIKKALGMDVEIAQGRRGSFEVTRDGRTVFSRLETGLFPLPEDVLEALEEPT